MIFDPSASYNSKAVRNRTLSDGSKQKFGEELTKYYETNDMQSLKQFIYDNCIDGISF